jgi:dimethylhistidine N-methyltransferase
MSVTDQTLTRPIAAGHGAADVNASLLAEVLAGLRRRPKVLPCKLFYDRRGSALFDRICTLPAYYPTRTESSILATHAADIARLVPRGAWLIELGSGSSTKTRLLLDAVPTLGGYVPIDISSDHLAGAADQLQRSYPRLRVRPHVADYTAGPLTLPPDADAEAPRVLFFPGSTIGNFHPDEAAGFLRRVRDFAGDDGALLIGVDLHKPADILLPAYDDAEGVTAAFNLNALARLNREFGATFDLDRFVHLAVWSDEYSRVEMHLVSVGDQRVELADRVIAFEDGETIHTESSYKHTPAAFERVAAAGGWRVRSSWMDARRWFAVNWLTPTP